MTARRNVTRLPIAVFEKNLPKNRIAVGDQVIAFPLGFRVCGIPRRSRVYGRFPTALAVRRFPFAHPAFRMHLSASRKRELAHHRNGSDTQNVSGCVIRAPPRLAGASHSGFVPLDRGTVPERAETLTAGAVRCGLEHPPSRWVARRTIEPAGAGCDRLRLR